MKKAEIIAVGSELLTPFRMDTNSLYLTRSLEECGYQLIQKSVIGDDLPLISNAFRDAFVRSDVIICTGGLGPTVDDLTRDGLVHFLQIPLILNQEILDHIEKRFAKRGLKMPEINKKQAMVPKGGVFLPNHNGTAPGIFLKTKEKSVFLLPGPPFELEPMWERYALPLLEKESRTIRKIFRIAMTAESQVDQALEPVHKNLKQVSYTILAAPAQIEIHLTGPESASGELDAAASEVRTILGNTIYAEGLETLEAVVGRMLTEKQKTLAVAESCTGGLLAQRLTDIAGSSAYFERGVVTYSNRAKMELLAVPEELLQKHGAVSEPVAMAMAQNLRERVGVDFALSITGIAGPDGGSEEKPVGTVFVGFASDNGCVVKKYIFPGTRDRIRFASTQAALNMLRLKLLE